MIALICASQSELKEFYENLAVKREYSYQCCSFVEGILGKQAILLAFFGRGSEHARQVAYLVLETYPVSLLISTGLCTSVNARVKRGDIAVYRRILDGIPVGAQPDTGEIKCDLGLLKTALQLDGRKAYRLVPVTAATVPESDAAAGFAFRADNSAVEVVDHESLAVCQLAAERNFPFFCARAVSALLSGPPASGAGEADSGQAAPNLADFLFGFLSLI